MATEVELVRAFNRFVPERIGAISDDFLGRRRPMGESRILWEVGEGPVEVRQLRSRLDLDSGYLTRVVQSLRRAGLVEVVPSRSDARVREVRLTRAGRAERAELDRLSDEVARSMLQPLNRSQRDRLVTAMREVERLLTASMVVIGVEDPASADARWCLAEYFAELDRRFETGFDPTIGISADPAELVPPAGEFIVARLRGRPVACGAVKFRGSAPAEIKRMWVAGAARGLGLGRRMLEALESRAAMAGARAARLETNRALVEAIALYRAAGYREVAPFNDEPHAHHWFEKALPRSR